MIKKLLDKIDWEKYFSITLLTSLMGTALIYLDVCGPKVLLYSAAFNLIVSRKREDEKIEE
ncbi:MAG: hypothetical protein SLAVMIC_00706 [uncultured marine phage]|uniref:Uncharacterized protein n=1 Tax=uncultured marine phage TaxID=707152 RepID=A0A8D9CCJ9_9VIRU|nr:MAG: hypothetical protein SLAVMIC_00706 [uncultured marine phage]